MNEIDSYNFQEQIRLFKKTIAPRPDQETYLKRTKAAIQKELIDKAKETGHPVERVLLTAICGELTNNSSKQQQAEFSTRLILLDLLTE